ncbi:MAG TPA: adenylate/guanylate cyclase domain-containing protein [Jiangellales bacterium]|nr:adenylate/guanylate cyclase domain-containing protein [Jiangellales bacterium]
MTVQQGIATELGALGVLDRSLRHGAGVVVAAVPAVLALGALLATSRLAPADAGAAAAVAVLSGLAMRGPGVQTGPAGRSARVPALVPDRVLTTVLFTDIVDSTRRAAALGDAAWRELLDRHDAVVRRQLARFEGCEVVHTGDGFLATFDRPGRAVRCALVVTEAVRELGLEVRAGLHTGEVELREDNVGGLGVHIGARVASLAEPGEVLVSQTVKELVAGAGLGFLDRGPRRLKGVPDEWRLFAARDRG